jgi:hypothetical protein
MDKRMWFDMGKLTNHQVQFMNTRRSFVLAASAMLAAGMTPIRRRYGVPDELSSCHTAIVAGYAIEGHVPAADIKRLLRERTKAKGLAVPGMVVGSPGMEQGPPRPYATIVFDERGSKIFEQH